MIFVISDSGQRQILYAASSCSCYSDRAPLGAQNRPEFYLGALPRLPPEPPLNAGVAKEVPAAQRRQAVVPSVGPLLKTDGTGIPLLLLLRGNGNRRLRLL